MADRSFPVTVHPYAAGKHRTGYAYELGTHPTPARNALVFIGGLGDGPHTVEYIRAVAKKLSEAPRLGYSVFETRLSSAFAGYGFSSLAKDVKELSTLVAYLRSLGKEKIVFSGHSTGCQDCMEYNDPRHGANPVDGFVLQGPVSDREAFSKMLPPDTLAASIAEAEELIKQGKADAIMPREKVAPDFKTPMTAYRWHSLVAAGGDDDYFSSDLPDSKLAAVWGRIRKPVLIVPSGADQYTPEGVDMERLVARWEVFCQPGIASNLSGLIPGASHEVGQPEAREWLADRIVRFLGGIEGVEVPEIRSSVL